MRVMVILTLMVRLGARPSREIVLGQSSALLFLLRIR